MNFSHHESCESSKSDTERVQCEIYAALFDDILSQKLSPGQRLSEVELAAKFEVSKTTVSDVLQRLTNENILLMDANKGTMVATTTPEEAWNYLEARRVVELELLSRAVEFATPNSLQRLHDLIEEEAVATKQGDAGKALRLSSFFHIEIAEMANNVPLAMFARRVICRCELIIAQYQEGDIGSHVAYVDSDHINILTAMESRDAQQSRELMSAHFDHIEATLSLPKKT